MCICMYHDLTCAAIELCNYFSHATTITKDPAFNGCDVGLSFNGSDSDIDETEVGIDGGDLSSYGSRGPLLAFLDNLYMNKYERALTIMSRDCNTNLALDLTKTNIIVSGLNKVTELYIKDFPAMPEPSAVVQTVAPSNTAKPIEVLTQAAAIVRQEEYDEKLQAWTESVEKYERDKISMYVRNRVEIVQDSCTDIEKVKTKLVRVPALNEKKRKLFVYDDTNEHPLDWDRLKKRRKSMHAPHLGIHWYMHR